MARAALAAYRQEARQTQIDALPRTDVLLCLFRYEADAIAGDPGQDDVVESVAEIPDEGGRRAPLLDHRHCRSPVTRPARKSRNLSGSSRRYRRTKRGGGHPGNRTR